MKQLIAAAVASACLLAAQDAPRPKNTYHSSGGASAAPRLVSPEVRPDRTIVFRLRAPEAAQVSLSFAGSKPMSKDDAGVWSATVGPVEPEIYQYNFVVDGVRILDPGNPNLKNGRAPDASIVEVPGNPPRFDELQAVPHGALAYPHLSLHATQEAAPALRVHPAAVRPRNPTAASRSCTCATAAATTKRTGATPGARA